MDLEFSEDETELRDNVRTVLDGVCPPSYVRAVHDGEEPASFWDEVVDLGWPALTIAEEHGGLGLGFVELALVMEELGRAVAPTPLLATMSQFIPAIVELGTDAAAKEHLPRVVSGERTGTLALAEGGRWSLDAVALRATPEHDGWILEGDKHTVVDGDRADEIVVIARSDDGLGAFVVPNAAAHSSPRHPLDPTLPVSDLHFDRVHVEWDRVLAVPGSEHVERGCSRVLEQATVTIAAATVGTCRAIFEMTLDHVKEREQYGRPIGSFQALKHRLVDAYLALERATALVYYATLTIAEDTLDRSTAAAASKAAAGDCQRLLAQEGLQLHGGIGFTWEHDLHFWLKRAKAIDVLFGGPVGQRGELARMLGLVRGRVAR